jgi:hypothetical protein
MDGQKSFKKKTMTYDIVNSCLGIGQSQKCVFISGTWQDVLDTLVSYN